MALCTFVVPVALSVGARYESVLLAFQNRSADQEVKEGFGNQINLCRDRGLNPGPPAQKSDTLPLDHQKSELFKYLEDVGLSGLVAVADDLALTRDSPRQHKITTSFKRFGEQLLTSLRWRTPVRQNDALFNKCVAAILESMLMMREDSYHVEYITSRSSHSHDQCHCPIWIVACKAVSPISIVACKVVSPISIVARKAVSPIWIVECKAVSPISIVACKAVSPIWIVACKAVSPILIVACKAISPISIVACKAISPILIVACKAVSPISIVACKAVSPISIAAYKAVSPILIVAHKALVSPISIVACKAVSPISIVACKAISPISIVACKAVSPIWIVACKTVSPISIVACKAISPISIVACKAVSPISIVACKAVSPISIVACKAISPISIVACKAVSPISIVACKEEPWKIWGNMSQGLLLALSGPLVAVWSRTVGAVVLATLGGSQLWRWFVTAQLNKRYWTLSRLIALQTETGAQIDKCFRLLKVRASTLGCLATVRTPAEQWCRVPMLRLCLRDSLLALSRLLHTLTRSLLEEVPLLPHVDNAQSYVCHCDWSTLVDDKETTDIHLDTLQKIKVLSIMVQSEFLRRLALSLCPALWTPRTSRTLDTVWRVLDSALGAYSQEIDRLTSCYLLYRDYQEPGCTAIRTPSLTWENTELLECIHAAILRIHLMSESSRLVERALEPGPGSLDLETLRGLVVELLVQSRKCSSAWEDSVKRIQTLVRTGGPAPSAQVTEPEEKTDEQQRVLVQVGYTDLDPQVEDEVFEEYALHKGEPAFDDDEVIIEEETRKRLRHCAALFSELKSVLCVKAEEMGRREAAALLRRNQEWTLKDKDVSCPAEEDDEGSSSFGTTVISPQTAPSDNEDDTDNLVASKLPNWPLPRLKKVTCYKRSKPRHHRKLLCRNSLPNKPKTVSCPNSCPGPAKESPAYPDKNFNTTELEPEELGQGAGGKDERVLHPNLSLFSDLAAEAAEVARCRQHLFLDSEDSLISSPNNTEETFSCDSDD
uniref:Vezatin n=1 Tax=Timema douglasi TaxID=61478 RepID=A0A7R8VN78_TIMDO|nr:unnamed protein product [Timema douglasi]